MIIFGLKLWIDKDLFLKVLQRNFITDSLCWMIHVPLENHHVKELFTSGTTCMQHTLERKAAGISIETQQVTHRNMERERWSKRLFQLLLLLSFLKYWSNFIYLFFAWKACTAKAGRERHDNDALTEIAATMSEWMCCTVCHRWMRTGFSLGQTWT